MPNLTLFLSRFDDAPYAWGEHDCFLMCCRWLARNGKPDPRDYFNCECTTYKQVMRNLKSVGMESLTDVFDSLLDRTLNPQHGDIVQIRSNNPVGSFGIYDGEKCITVNENIGLIMHNEAMIVGAWRVRGGR